MIDALGYTNFDKPLQIMYILHERNPGGLLIPRARGVSVNVELSSCLGFETKLVMKKITCLLLLTCVLLVGCATRYANNNRDHTAAVSGHNGSVSASNPLGIGGSGLEAAR